ncbi:MAG: hypothetical protein K1X71_03315 [Pirellulales bacterium]|nr:hypothetical protein [Pirellulales bacterium]
MQINKLSPGQLVAPILGKANESGAAGIAADAAAGESQNGSSTVGHAAFRQIMEDYDVTQITPREFSSLIRELHAAGAINETEMQELSSIRFELDRANVAPDEEVNLVEMFTDRLKKLTTGVTDAAMDGSSSDTDPESRERSLSLAQRQMEWVSKFDAIRQEISHDALNAIV